MSIELARLQSQVDAWLSDYQKMLLLCCRLLKGEGADRGPLTSDELARLHSQVDAWLSDSSPNAALELGGSMLHIRAALELLKKYAKQGGHRRPGAAKDADAADPADQLRKLQLQVRGFTLSVEYDIFLEA